MTNIQIPAGSLDGTNLNLTDLSHFFALYFAVYWRHEIQRFVDASGSILKSVESQFFGEHRTNIFLLYSLPHTEIIPIPFQWFLHLLNLCSSFEFIIVRSLI